MIPIALSPLPRTGAIAAPVVVNAVVNDGAPRSRLFARARAALAVTLALCTAVQPADAAQTQLSTAPLASATSATVKPNIMYLMDTSGSMSSLDMPDSVGSNTGRIGYKNHLCNLIYYNPAITYVVPKKSDGSNFATPSFTGAYPDGYTNYPTGPSSGAVNLSSAFKAHSADTAQAAYYYTYTGSQTLVPSTGGCLNTDGNATTTYNTNIATTGGGNWQKIKVTSTSGPASTDERTNFAIWYQYYRDRLMMMKGTASRAFNQLTDSYRVGFITISPGNPVSSAQYEPIRDFDSTQRDLWFTKLFAQDTHDSTPLREALSRVGRHYAGKTDGLNSGMTGDPVQYSCQQNFTLLTTDGYWNGSGGDDLNGNALDSTSTDSDITVTPRPMWDGGAAVNTTTNKSNTYRNTTCSTSMRRRVQQQQQTIQYQTRLEETKQRTQQIQQRTQQFQSRTVQHQTRTQQIQQRAQQIQSRTQQVQQRTQQLQRRTNQLQRKTEQLQQKTEQLQQQTLQLQRKTEQQQRQTTTTTLALGVLIINASSTTQTSTISAITIGGSNRLPATSSVASGATAAVRNAAHATNIAGQTLSGGYGVFDSGACTGSNLGAGGIAVSGCATTMAYVRIMVPFATPTLSPSVGTSDSRVTTSLSSFSGGGINAPTPTNVASCSTSSTTSPANVTVDVTCPISNTGFANLAASSCTDTAGVFNGSGTRISCQTTDTLMVNLAATSCTPTSPPGVFDSSGKQILCNTVDPGFVNLAATSCTPSSPTTSFNSSGQRFSCQIVDPGFVDLAAASCTPSSPATSFNSSGQRFSCQTVTGTYANLAATSCTTTSTPNTSGQTFDCQTTDTNFVNAASCTATTPINTFNSSGTQITCQTTDTGFVNASSCTTSSASGQTITCQTTDTGFVNATTCTANSGPISGFTRTCQTTDTGFVNSAACTASNSAGQTVTCTTTSDTGFVNVNACTASNPAGGPTVTCNTASDTTFVNATTCTASSPAGGPTVTCQTADTGFVYAASCTPSVTGGETITCQITDTGFVNSGSCTASTSTGYRRTCQITSDSGASNVSSCTASDPASGPTVTCPTTDTGWLESSSCSAGTSSGRTTTCQTVSGWQKLQYQTTTSTTTTNLSSGVSSTSVPSTGSWSDVSGVCTATAATLPASGTPGPGEPPTPTAPCTAWPCTITGSSGGSTGSLADVAQYYYNTDLRPTMANNVPAGGTGIEDDKATWQHMTTFTMGLGLAGQLTYRTDYKTANTGDFQNIRDGLLNWPVPSSDNPTALDDLWHAAANGRGQFFSASNPDSVVDGLATALAGIQARVSSAAAAATSNLEPVAGDNFAYTAKYKTLEWTGELEAHEINLSTGDVGATVIWSAQSALDALVGNACDKRSIYLFRAGASNNRVNFSWNTQTCDGSFLPTGTADTGLNASEKAYFGATAVAALSQYATMTDGTGTPATANQRALAVDDKLVNFVRGQRGYENFTTNDANKLYRQRTHVLGDIVNAQPVYVKTPFASYTDEGYLNTHTVTGATAFKTTGVASTRLPMVYVAANDGMLHAFYAGSSTTDVLGGKERWAFIPSMVLPNLYKLADDNYPNNHRYSVDGTPTVGDFYDTSGTPAWKTMLVAGMNSGAKGYYALDITDPDTPKGLWEFKWSDTCYDASNSSTAYADCHVGYTFNDPILTKLTDGTWVVIVTSGYNNVNAPVKAGDGQGYLYVLRAYDGKILYKISTGSGNATTPSGLNHTINWVDSTLVNNTTLRVYAGDLLGNLWRFDVNDNINPTGREATLIGQAKSPGASGLPQPISTRPELALKGSDTFIMFATGQLLGSDDLSNTQVHSIWGVVDPLTNTTTAYTDMRASMKPMAMTQVGTGASATRTVACTGSSSACNVTTGWVIDLPDSGERVNVDPKLQLGTLVVASNVPQTSACTIGGYSWINFVNFTTGAEVANSTGGAASQKLSDSLAVGLNIVRLPDGKTVVITTTSDAKQTTVAAPFDTPSPTGKRISWREITQ